MRPALLSVFSFQRLQKTEKKNVAAKHWLRTACQCVWEASNKRMGCDSTRCLRRAKARMVMLRAMGIRLFHAFFWLARCTYRGEAACRATKSFTRKAAPFPTTTCGNNGWMSGLSHIKATWVRFASPAMPSRVAAQREAPFASWRRCFPSHLLGTKTQGSCPG